MIYIRAWMSLKFGQIRPSTTELADLKRLKKMMFPFVSLCIYPIHFKFLGIEDMIIKYAHSLMMGKMVFPTFLGCFRCNLFDTFR